MVCATSKGPDQPAHKPLPVARIFYDDLVHDKRDDSDFEVVNFPFQMVLFLARQPMESISLNSFALLKHNKFFNRKLLKQGYRYH